MKNTITLPVKNFVEDGNLLMDWLGTFWSQIYTDKEFAQQLQNGQGLLSAQLYLNFLESIGLLNRNNAPPFHRERWKAITIKLSEANTGKASLLTADMDPPAIIGPQTSNTYIQDETFEIGGNAEYTNAVSYPLSAGTEDILTTITDSIVNPKVLLVRGIDFIVRDNTLFFLHSKDPFANADFSRRTVVDANGVEDEEILLWAADVLIDKDFIYNYIGYILNIKTASSEYYKKMLNAVWDVYNHGTTLKYFRSALGAIFDEPVVLEATETVEVIIDDTNRQVITDKHVYDISTNSTLRSAVTVNSTLNAGDFLTETIRIYETLDPMKLNAVSEYGERFKTDVYSMFFDPSMLRTCVKFGIGASWKLSDIINAGTDDNGNSKLKFDLYGDTEDIDAFWLDFWAYLEANKISSSTCFQDYMYDTILPSIGAVCGRVPPLEFFLRYFLKANGIIVVIDSDEDRAIDMAAALGTLKKTMPAHAVLFFIEQRHLGPEEYELADLSESIEECISTTVSDTARPGGPSPALLTYKDRGVSYKWLPTRCN